MVSASPSSDAPARTGTPRVVRRDIQGLRAVAVLAVVLHHLAGRPVGGFVGVDIFFVISGFLITGHLYREHQRTGRILLAQFYRRRVRRIVPVATLVLAVTVVVGYAVYLPARAGGIAVDGVWALLFVANWHLALEGTDYWADDGLLSPLQHYWSLGVEEQFYLVWPWLVLLGLALGAGVRRALRGLGAARPARWYRVGLTTVLAPVVVASFGWAMWQTGTDPTWAYYSTLSRAWELGVGALLAVHADSLRRIRWEWRPVLGAGGLLGIVVSCLGISPTVSFPAPWAALPVVSTALVIAAGTGAAQAWQRPLTNAVAVYVGDISYSLYLWHFPVIALLPVVMPVGPTYHLAVVVLVLLLSVASYHGVENPVRRSAWLEPRAERNHLTDRQRVRRYQVATIAALVVADVVVAGMALRPRTPPDEAVTLASTSAASSVTGSSITGSSLTEGARASATPVADPGDAVAELQREIAAALAAETFPELSPPVAELGTQAWVERATQDGCADVGDGDVERCTSGPADAPKQVVVLGDSFGIAWLPGIRSAVEPGTWSVRPLTRGQCPSITVAVTRDGGARFPECDRHRDWALDQIAAVKPDVVVLADAFTTMDRLASGARGARAGGEVRDGLEATIAAVAPHAGRVVVLGPPPAGANLQECVTRAGRPSDCARRVTPDWRTFTASAEEAARAGGAQYVDTRLWFCDVDGLCPGFVGRTPVRADVAHLTVEYSERLAPLLREAIGLT